MRTVTSLLLALMLALTSQSMAVARGASAATGEIVLCTSTGPMAVHVDANGNPTSAPHICPDALLHLVADRPAQVSDTPATRLLATLSATLPASLNASHRQVIPYGRAPPALI